MATSCRPGIASVRLNYTPRPGGTAFVSNFRAAFESTKYPSRRAWKALMENIGRTGKQQMEKFSSRNLWKSLPSRRRPKSTPRCANFSSVSTALNSRPWFSWNDSAVPLGHKSRRGLKGYTQLLPCDHSAFIDGLAPHDRGERRRGRHFHVCERFPFFPDRTVKLTHRILARFDEIRRNQLPHLFGAVLVEQSLLQIDRTFLAEDHVPLAVGQLFERTRMEIELAVIDVHVVLMDV